MKIYLQLLKNGLALGLCVSVSLDVLAPAASAQSVPAQGAPTSIDLIVLEGEGVTYTSRQHLSRNLVVRVEDDDHRPVEGASVVFALPMSGASGDFAGAKTLSVVTDKNGQATARGLRTNQIPGKLQIYVTASYRGARTKTLITQFIEGEPGAAPKVQEVSTHRSSGKWKWVVLAVAAGAGASAGVYFATRKSSSASPISVTAGTVIFGSSR